MVAGALSGEHQLFTAHRYATAREMFLRIASMVEGSEFASQVRRVTRSSGREGVEFANGGRLSFRVRTRSSCRGVACDVVYLDEADKVDEPMLANVLPMLAYSANPQLWRISEH
jgi:hypothetical protein